MRHPLSPRPRQHPVFGVLLLLVGVVALRSWCQVLESFSGDENAFGDGPCRLASSTSGDDTANAQCDWQEENGAVLFRLQHNKMHPKATHWFHIAECFTGLRAGLEAAKMINDLNGTVYLQVLDSRWMKKLSPMARLLILAGLSRVGAEVHFIDYERAHFSYPQLQNTSRSQTSNLATAAIAPPAGQIGRLHFNAPGQGREFVVSTQQSLPDRLLVTADASTLRRTDGGGLRRSTGGAAAVAEGNILEGPEKQPVCVKYMSTVGTYGVQRVDWFPSLDHAMSMRCAIDSFCPISWLGRGRVTQGEGGEGQRRGEPGGDKVGEKRLLIYQRDKNRIIVGVKGIADRLRERLEPHGWRVTEMVHDSNQHPCKLVDEMARTDVLLTAHGFQSMLALFMRPQSLLFEIFPHKYWKAGYAPMAKGLAVRYAFSESPPRMWFLGHRYPSMKTCMKWYLCRWYARQSNVEFDDASFERLVELALETR